MNRVTPADVLSAYQFTNTVPAIGGYYWHGCACPLSAILIANGVDLRINEDDNESAETPKVVLHAIAGVTGPFYPDGFVRGFDWPYDPQHDEDEEYRSPEYRLGVEDGRLARLVVEHLLGSPVELDK